MDSSLRISHPSAADESWIKLIERGCQIFSQIKQKLFPVKVYKRSWQNLW